MNLKCSHPECKEFIQVPFWLWVFVRNCWLCEEHRFTQKDWDIFEEEAWQRGWFKKGKQTKP